MQNKLRQLANRLEGLSTRERAMVLIGVPLVLVVAGEMIVFGPARKQTAEAQVQTQAQQAELKALEAVLVAQPAVAPLPGADQLQQQRQELQDQIDAARQVRTTAVSNIDWGTVVRAAATGTPGLSVTKLRTLPVEIVFEPASFKPEVTATPKAGTAPAAPATAPKAAAAASAPQRLVGDTIYRHRVELSVDGNMTALLAYLQTLQHTPGGLHWERMSLSPSTYPQANVQLTLYTLSTRAETPFLEIELLLVRGAGGALRGLHLVLVLDR